MGHLSSLDPWVLGLAFLIAGLLAVEVGHRVGIKVSRELDADDRSVLETIHAAILALVGLLLGFSFSMAVGEHLEQRRMVVQEANAIGTAFLRADLADAPEGPAIKQLLIEYVDARLKMVEAGENVALIDEAEREASALQERMWANVRLMGERPVESHSFSLTAQALNDVIDMQSTRAAALRTTIPFVAWGLLLGSTAVALTGLGIRCGLARRRMFLATGLFVFLACLVLTVIMDLDRPRKGLVHVSQQPMLELKASMTKSGM